MPVTDTMDWQPIETIPMDGTEILIKTDTGIVSAWFCHEEPTNDAKDNGCYDWICYDDMIQIDGHDNNIEGWAPIMPNPRVQPAATEPVKQAGRGPLGCDGLLGADVLSEGQS